MSIERTELGIWLLVPDVVRPVRKLSNKSKAIEQTQALPVVVIELDWSV